MVYLNLRNCIFKNISMCADVNDPQKLAEMESWFSFNISYDEDLRSGIAVLSQELRSKQEPEKFNISLDAIGSFSCDGIENEDDQRQAHIEAYHLLFGHVQTMVAQLTTKAGLPPLMIETGRMDPDKITFGDTAANNGQTQ